MGPFVNLHQLNPGDLIVAEGPDVAYVYMVSWVEVVTPTDIWVTEPTDNPAITLITCTDWNKATWTYRSRLAVRAELVEH
jgi:sortase A